jgi:D-serine deaminase-like pyridoxal phosphate-dependent protein
MQISDLVTPAVLIDRFQVEQNTHHMAKRAHTLGVRLRPHVKTHKCVEIARLQVADHFGGITVSTFAEAKHFAAGGFRDITLAVPVALGRIDGLLDFARQLGAFHLLVDSPIAVDALESAARRRGQRVSVYLKVDCGYGRAGVVPGTDAAIALAAHLHGSDCIDFRGLLAHGGHSYDCVNRAEIRVVAEQERAVVVGFADELRSQGLTISEVSIGSTPTMCVAEDLTGVTEIRPGNYALFDRFQATIGSCSMDEVAISVLATVIGAYPDRVLLDCGALALSKDPGPVHVDPDGGFGLLLTPDMRPVEGLSLVGLSQEHGKAKGPGATQFQVGDRMRVVPNHSCLTMACFEQVHIVDGTRVVDAWKPCRGW